MTIISISGVIGWDVTPDNVRDQLKEASGDVVVEIGSPGGFVFDGLEIFNLLRDYNKGTVTTKLMGIAASMASYIALAGDKVTAHDNAIFMIHNAMSFVSGNHNDMREQADFLEKLSNHLAKAYVNKTGQSLEEIKSIMDKEGWFYGDEAKEAGFVDEIIETSDKKDKESAKIEAVASIVNCKKIISDLENTKEDLKKAAASITKIKPEFLQATPENKQTKITNEETKIMETLEKFLAENTGAKADFDKAIASANEAGQKIVQNRIDSAKDYLSNEAYPTLSTMAVKVLSGDLDATALTASVAAIDALLESKKSENAKTETEETKETPAQVTGSKATAEENYQAKKARLRG